MPTLRDVHHPPLVKPPKRPPVTHDGEPHAYRLHYYGAAEDETVTAGGPHEAVAARLALAMPSGITDLDVMTAWLASIREHRVNRG